MKSAIASVLAQSDEQIQAATVPPITFVVTAVIGIAIILLGLDLVRRIRRSQNRELIQQSLEAEIGERGTDDPASTEETAEPDARDPSSPRETESTAEPGEGTGPEPSDTQG